jgi:hypothetical protein
MKYAQTIPSVDEVSLFFQLESVQETLTTIHKEIQNKN